MANRLHPSPTPTLAKTCTVVVQAGDNLTLLAKRHLGDPARWREIQELNQIREPNMIRVGQAIMLPCYPDSGDAPGGPQPQAGEGTRTGRSLPHNPRQAALDREDPEQSSTTSSPTWAIKAGWTPNPHGKVDLGTGHRCFA